SKSHELAANCKSQGRIAEIGFEAVNLSRGWLDKRWDGHCGGHSPYPADNAHAAGRGVGFWQIIPRTCGKNSRPQGLWTPDPRLAGQWGDFAQGQATCSGYHDAHGGVVMGL